MIRTLCLSALLLVECMLASVCAQEPERPGQEAFIKRAVFAQQRLWLLSDSGVLSSVVDGGDKRIGEHLAEPVLELCVPDGDPLIVTGQQDSGTGWALHRWQAGEWQRPDSNRSAQRNDPQDRVESIEQAVWRPAQYRVRSGERHHRRTLERPLQVGDALWAVGIDGLYRITHYGLDERVALPKFKEVDGVNVSFDIPGLVLVGTQVNRRRSVSGTVPMLVPR